MQRCDIVKRGAATLIRAPLSAHERHIRSKMSSPAQQAVPRTKARRAAGGLLAIGFSPSAGLVPLFAQYDRVRVSFQQALSANIRLAALKGSGAPASTPAHYTGLTTQAEWNKAASTSCANAQAAQSWRAMPCSKVRSNCLSPLARPCAFK